MADDDEAQAREAARLQRTMANVGKARERPRSWGPKKPAELVEQKEAVQKEEIKAPIQSTVQSTPTVFETDHVTDTRTPEEILAAQEKQTKLEEERFNKYMNKLPQQKVAVNTDPLPPSHLQSGKGPTLEKTQRQAILLDISGPGASKGEAGKETHFIVKTKSVAIDASNGSVTITVKITAKGLDGQLVHVSSTVSPDEDKYRVYYTPIATGLHTVEVSVNGQIAHSFNLQVTEGGPYPAYTEAAWESLKGLSVGNKAQLVVSPMSFLRRLAPLGYSSLSAKVDYENTSIKNVSVLGNKEGRHVVSFYPAQPGDHIITVHLNGEHISGSPYIFNVAQ